MISSRIGKQNLHIKFCKHLMGVGKKSTNIAVISELGRYPMYCYIIQSILLYWHRLENCPESSLLHRAYTENINLNSRNINCWFKNLKYFKDRIGISLSNGKNITLSSFRKQTKNLLRKQFLVYWEKHREISLKAGKLTSYFLLGHLSKLR